MQNENTPAEGKDSDQRESESALRGAACSAFALWWGENGLKIEPPVMQEAMREIAAKGWSAAIKAADSAAWDKRDKWDEGDGYSPTKAAAAEEIGYSIRRLFLPNDERMCGETETPNATAMLPPSHGAACCASSFGGDYVNLGGGFRDDKNRILCENVGGKTYEIPFDHLTSLVTKIVTEGVMTGLLSLDYLETLLKGYEGVRGRKMMYPAVPVYAAPSSQQSMPSPVQNQ